MAVRKHHPYRHYITVGPSGYDDKPDYYIHAPDDIVADGPGNVIAIAFSLEDAITIAEAFAYRHREKALWYREAHTDYAGNPRPCWDTNCCADEAEYGKIPDDAYNLYAHEECCEPSADEAADSNCYCVCGACAACYGDQLSS